VLSVEAVGTVREREGEERKVSRRKEEKNKKREEKLGE
jgi:hypothetical protein